MIYSRNNQANIEKRRFHGESVTKTYLGKRQNSHGLVVEVTSTNNYRYHTTPAHNQSTQAKLKLADFKLNDLLQTKLSSTHGDIFSYSQPRS
jgi:hypothetical protein